MTAKPELVLIVARLVGNKTGNVYSESAMFAETIFKEPELYLGDCVLSIPQHPVMPPLPDLDPEDTEIILQFQTNTPNTRFGRNDESPFLFIGHWRGWIDVRPKADVELPSGGIS